MKFDEFLTCYIKKEMVFMKKYKFKMDKTKHKGDFHMNKNVKLGIPFDDIDAVTKDIEKMLHIQFTEHESSYWGIYNLAKLSETENIRILYNFVDDDWQEEDHKDLSILIELNRLNEPEKIVKLLSENLPYIVPLYLEEVESRKFIRRYKYEDGLFKLDYEYIFKK